MQRHVYRRRGAVSQPQPPRRHVCARTVLIRCYVCARRLDLQHNQDGFLVSFEPLLDKYAVLLSRGTRRFHPEGGGDRSVPLAHHHKRGIVLPLAISPKGGWINFYVSTVAGCSSMLRVNRSVSWAGGDCARP